MRLIAPLTLWIFVIGTGFILGAALYEMLVVVPFWAGNVPQSLMDGNPFLRVPIRSGQVFWPVVTPGLGIVALAAFLTSFGMPQKERIWRLAATGLFLVMTILTLAYFRPSIINMVVHHGAGRSGDALAAGAKMWVALNWLRIAAVAASLGIGLRALTLPALAGR
jgi:hypothetical protein